MNERCVGVDEQVGLRPPLNFEFSGLQLVEGLNPPLIDSDS